MARLSYDVLDKIKESHGVEKIWSFSRWNTFYEYPWIYRMTYLEKKPRGQNIYGYWGTICHDIIQDFYDGKYPYKDMIKIFEKTAVEWKRNGEYKFMSEKVEKSYIKNLHNYFSNTEIVPYEVVNELPIKIVMTDKKRDNKQAVFIGYADSIYTDDDNITYILDYKTSSKSGFSGVSLEEKSRQLRLYAIGLHQMKGIPYENLRCRFDMQKYYEVWHHSVLATGKEKLVKSKQERFSWVSGVSKKIIKELAKLDYDPFEIDEMIEVCIEDNSIKTLPQEVQDKFELHNCYIDVEITEEQAEDLMELMLDVIDEIEEKEKMDWDEAFPEPDIYGNRQNQFYFETLASHLLPYAKKYQENKAMVEGDVPDEDLLDLFK